MRNEKDHQIDSAKDAKIAPPVMPNYPPAVDMPTQEGPEGIRFDFNLSARLFLPDRAAGMWRVTIRDLDTGKTVHQAISRGGLVQARKRYFVRYSLEASEMTGPGAQRVVFTHDFNARNQNVLVQLPDGALGDTIAWFPYAARFASRHGCQLTCALPATIIPLFRDAYPDIRLVTHEEVASQNLADTAYATYSVGLFVDNVGGDDRPVEFKIVGLHRTAAAILGVDDAEEPPRLALPDETRPIAEPYVCIAVQASAQCKYWNNPRGWHAVVDSFRQRGYRVICIDRERVYGSGLVWNHIPNGADDETGDRPLTERARWLLHAEAFVGLPSGLSWLAWAAGCPVVMISGFSDPVSEFTTPYRVINRDVCNSCWNDLDIRYNRSDFLWCPRHAGTDRQFECTKRIAGAQVIAAIDAIPGIRPVHEMSSPLSAELVKQ